MNSNENPHGASPLVQQAALLALQSTHHYPDMNYHELKSALADFLAVNADQITPGNGSENILELIIKTFLHENDNVIVSQYAFYTIPMLLQHYAIHTKVIPLKNWHTDIEAMIAAIDESTRMIFLVNPDNPVGTYTNNQNFMALMQGVPERVLVVVDEAYLEYIHVTDYPDTLSCLSQFPNLLLTRTFSKAYGLAALRVGYAISSAAIAAQINQQRLPYNVNAIAIKAACAALLDQEHIKKTLQANAQGRLQLEQGLRALNISFFPSVTNFITINMPNADNIRQQLKQKGVHVFSVHHYDLQDYLRVTIGIAEQNAYFLAAIRDILQTCR